MKIARYVVLATLATLLGAASQGPRYKILYSFTGGLDGSTPSGDLIMDQTGALYGTASFGGAGNCFGGCGRVFKLTLRGSSYVETTLLDFKGADGEEPSSGVIADSTGALYGTTEHGGTAQSYGTVFKLSPSASGYKETVLYRFQSGSDGANPLGGLVMDGSGALYGTTLLGGGAPACGQASGKNLGCGTVFKLTPSGSGFVESILHHFRSEADGATPGDTLLLRNGILYGTAATGGGPTMPCTGGAPINRGCGTVFALQPIGSGYEFNVLYAFRGSPLDGANPFGALTVDSNGALYSSTQYGGTQDQGSVFQLTPAGSGYTERTLHSFAGSSDGAYPITDVTIYQGRLFGTTTYNVNASLGAGILYELTPTGSGYSEAILHQFTSASGYPQGGLLVGPGGLFFGTVTVGGVSSSSAGAVFSFLTSAAEEKTRMKKL